MNNLSIYIKSNKELSLVLEWLERFTSITWQNNQKPTKFKANLGSRDFSYLCIVEDKLSLSVSMGWNCVDISFEKFITGKIKEETVPFSIDEYFCSVKSELGEVMTNSGLDVRVLCCDGKSKEFPVVALVKNVNGSEEMVGIYNRNGESFDPVKESPNGWDLVIRKFTFLPLVKPSIVLDGKQFGLTPESYPSLKKTLEDSGLFLQVDIS